MRGLTGTRGKTLCVNGLLAGINGDARGLI